MEKDIVKYYNQNDYPNSPYPKPSEKGKTKTATIQSGGCGVCCGSTILSFFGVDMPPEKLAKVYIAMGARAETGTDMRKAVNIICELGKLDYATTSSETVLAEHLRTGGIAMANSDGNDGEPGVFSNGGHYIVVLEARANGDFKVFDVGYYPGKYNSTYRAGKVKLEGQFQVCSTATLHMDTLHRTPNYYLFSKVEEKMPVYEKLNDVPVSYRPTIQKLMEQKALVGVKDPDPTRLDDNILNIDETYCRVMTTLDKKGLLG